MKRFIFSLVAALIIAPAAVFASTGSTHIRTEKSFAADAHNEMDIVDTAVSAKMFNTLVAAVKAADLVHVLKSDGPFTVFAPTDAAFAKLPAGTVETLLKPENKDMLVSILKYHVVSGKAMAKDVVGMNLAKTVQGQNVSIMLKGGKVFLNGSTQVIKTDIGATNGVIHVIDSVLMPPKKSSMSGMDIVDTAVSTNMFNTLVAAVKAAGLVETLKGDGPFTVLAPTDEAFAKLPAGTVETLLKPENKDMLVKILTYHVISGKVEAAQVVKLNKARTVQGSDVMIKTKNGKVMINKSNVVKTDVQASNGVIHVIDSVLMPPKKMSKTSSKSNSSGMNIVETAASTKMFNTLLTAAKTAGMADIFANKGPFTVLAPTDEAFAKLPAGTVDNLLKPANRAMLIKVLLYHIVPGKVEASSVVTLDEAPTAAGMPIMIKVDNGNVMLNNSAKVIKTDIQATNGVIHVIDNVLMPK